MLAEVYEASGLPKEIFVFQVTAHKELPDLFVKVATLPDIAEYPVTAADLGKEIPYYRMATVSLVFASMDTLLETKNMMEEDINGLVRSRRAQDAVPAQEDVTFDGGQSTTDLPWDSGTLSQ